MVHRFFEKLSFSWRAFHKCGFVRFYKIIDIADIIGRFLIFLESFYGCGSPCSHDPCYENIVAHALDVQSGLDGFEGSFLADDFIADNTIFRCLERDVFWFYFPSEFIWGQFLKRRCFFHKYSPCALAEIVYGKSFCSTKYD